MSHEEYAYAQYITRLFVCEFQIVWRRQRKKNIRNLLNTAYSFSFSRYFYTEPGQKWSVANYWHGKL